MNNNLQQTIEQGVEQVDIDKYHGKERTEEVQDIIERMPTKFGLWISVIVLSLFTLLIFFGWLIRYPDIVRGQVMLNTTVSPIKLVANTSGKLHLNAASQVDVKSDEVVAYIESATSFDTLEMIKGILKDYNPNNVNNISILNQLPARVALGELTGKYYNFLSALHQLQNFNSDKLFDKQISSLQSLHSEQQKEIANSAERMQLSQKNLGFVRKFFARDSTLHVDKVVAEAELDKSQIDFLNSQSDIANAKSSQIEAGKQAQQTLSRITEIDIQKSEKRKELELAVLASYNDLRDNITQWEQRYVFKAPFDGQIQFLRFWTNKQFVQAGEPVFTIIPSADKPYGQVTLPAMGAGKVEKGQEVIIKLDDYPYLEYGSIKGTVAAISLTTNTEKTPQGNLETYLVTVQFHNGLVTNYGKPLTFKQEAKGSAEIITKDRKLIQRIFDNLRYAVKK